MSEYLVRWKFGPNSLLNPLEYDTHWYQQFHPSKEKAVRHYSGLLFGASPSMKMTAEIFQLVQLVPGQPEPKDIVDEILEKVEPKKDHLPLAGNMKTLFDCIKENPGICRIDLQKKAKVPDKDYNNTMTMLRRHGLTENRGTRQHPKYHVV